MRPSTFLFTTIVCFTTHICSVYAAPMTRIALSTRQQSQDANLADDLVRLIEQRAAEVATGSWENGTLAEAILEYHYPQLSVFGRDIVPVSTARGIPGMTNRIAATTIRYRPNTTWMFCWDLSAGDPASLGVAILLANMTESTVDYTLEIDKQNYYLYNIAHRTSDGALSHRVDELQLWSDFMAMVPPYLAYYGVMKGDNSYVQQAYLQLSLYRNYLMEPNSTHGLLRHIVMGNQRTQDVGLWATGNAWAAWGMVRVLATMLNAGMGWDYRCEDLRNWAVTILQSAFVDLNSTTGLLPNYLRNNNTALTFSDASATALLAATSYRLASMRLDYSTLSQAAVARRAAFASINITTGWVAPVVDPMNWYQRGYRSAEGQSFVVILAASYRDYLTTS